MAVAIPFSLKMALLCFVVHFDDRLWYCTVVVTFLRIIDNATFVFDDVKVHVLFFNIDDITVFCQWMTSHTLFVSWWCHGVLSTNDVIAFQRTQDHDDDEEGGGGGGSSASKTFAKLKEMGAEMKVGMTKLAEKKVRMFQLRIFRLKPKPKPQKVSPWTAADRRKSDAQEWMKHRSWPRFALILRFPFRCERFRRTVFLWILVPMKNVEL